MILHCPNCDSTRLKKSRSGNRYLPAPLSLLVVSVRCCHCGKKFYRWGVDPGREIPAAARHRGKAQPNWSA